MEMVLVCLSYRVEYIIYRFVSLSNVVCMSSIGRDLGVRDDYRSPMQSRSISRSPSPRDERDYRRSPSPRENGRSPRDERDYSSDERGYAPSRSRNLRGNRHSLRSRSRSYR